ncbi:hypothetical protein FOA52_013047 [Chlamydomonas sp. UWO 241]|nr:hypothetical protein FOA52_013047 [Chlamydomonas sp. UWO 241]
MVDLGLPGGLRRQALRTGEKGAGSWQTWVRNALLILSSSILFFAAGYYLGLSFASSDTAAAYATPSNIPRELASSAPAPAQAKTQPIAVPKYEAVVSTLCSDTCAKAKDGVCDDGRVTKKFPGDAGAKGTPVLCDMGTDCSDCGTWFGYKLPPMDGFDSPVAYLKGQDVDVRTSPTLCAAATHRRVDSDVSHMVDRVGLLEGGITQVFYESLHKHCVQPDGSRGLVIDVGANFGYFSVYSALMGCRVIAWEPVPMFRAFVRYNVQLNNVSHLVELRGAVVGETDGEVLEMHVPKTGVWGTASVGGINQFILNQDLDKIKVPSERVDSVVNEDVLLLKVDVEGYEPIVFRSLVNLLRERQVDNIVLEYNPGTAERMYPAIDLMEENPAMLLDLLQKGYRLMQLDDNYGKGGDIQYDSGIPPLPEVTAQNLKYDIADAQLYKKQKLGCPKPHALHDFARNESNLRRMPQLGNWVACNLTPEDIHPKSFRSMYPVNTNVWAVHPKAHTRGLAKRSRIASIFELEQDLRTTWVSTHGHVEGLGHLGVGSRVCHYLDASVLVRSRCSCSHAKEGDATKYEMCLEEEKFVMQLVAEGKMPWVDVPH